MAAKEEISKELKQELKKLLMIHEGLKLRPYRDTAGKLTIGVGRNLDDKGIREIEADLMLDNDIGETIQNLDHYLPWWTKLSPNRKLVLMDMCFNLGIGKLLTFKKALAAMKEGRWNTAADEMKDSKWARQVGRRADKLAYMMRTGSSV
jgi:lysozyme